MTGNGMPKDVAALCEAARNVARAAEPFSPGNMGLENLTDCLETLFERFAPFRVGDVVRLTSTPEISDTVGWGWMGGKHFLIAGAKADVVEVYVRGREFYAGILFHDDSRKDLEGVLHPTPLEKRGSYTFCETSLERA